MKTNTLLIFWLSIIFVFLLSSATVSNMQSKLENFYRNSVIRKVVVDELKMGTKKTVAEIELLAVKKYTKDTMLKIPSPSKKEVSLMFETVQNFGSFTNGGQVHKSASFASKTMQEEGTY